MNDDDDDDDRRRAERVQINEEFGRLPEATYISDLSEYGVFVQTKSPPALGTKVSLRFTVLLDDPTVIEAAGLVVRHSRNPRGMGIEFTNLPPETLLQINDIIARESRPPDASSSQTFDSALTHAKGQIPLRAGALSVRSSRVKGGGDADDHATSRYPALDSSVSGVGEILGTGEFEVVEDDGDGE